MTVHETEKPDADTPPVTPGDATTRASYQLYFTSGFYDRRYPSPNRTMWRRITHLLGPDAAVLDFGCGSGRYLLRLQGLVSRAAGFDVSPAALETVRARAAASGWTDLAVIGPETTDLDHYIEVSGRVDLVLCLFGVLGHITDPAARADALGRMRAALKPGAGRLLISVPNRARRFRSEQTDSARDGLVHYRRRTDDGQDVVLHYQLFDPQKLTRELTAAGFALERLSCESVLPESWLLHNGLARWIDRLLTPVCPVRWGYGICAEASC
ncbi:bifunctional 2-polyprenyl-6-hydroxyphenol methylase/3-demethylubiquinol 3-O-methyltransferase UbiG [uncultured Roseobacter sp.]|uniref:class I SAM-dependent methyltransferase n=1 Tax=uncultured Roseobacter sp. TaxID=114847 RepID=UPI00260ECED4|nr:class I SAM-dependent methyltransferase [uncultured Roseobacter sp.]